MVECYEGCGQQGVQLSSNSDSFSTAADVCGQKLILVRLVVRPVVHLVVRLRSALASAHQG